MAADDDLERELHTAIEVRRDVGEELEPAVVDAFVARIEERIAERAETDARALKAARDHQKEMVLGAMGISVPLMLFAALWAGLPGVVVVCVTLVAIAVATRPR